MLKTWHNCPLQFATLELGVRKKRGLAAALFLFHRAGTERARLPRACPKLAEAPRESRGGSRRVPINVPSMLSSRAPRDLSLAKDHAKPRDLQVFRKSTATAALFLFHRAGTGRARLPAVPKTATVILALAAEGTNVLCHTILRAVGTPSLRGRVKGKSWRIQKKPSSDKNVRPT
jgi:hypothetical protein